MITKDILAQLENNIWPTVMHYVIKYHPASPDYLKVMEMSKDFSIWSTNMLLESGFSSEKGKIGADLFPGKKFFDKNILTSVNENIVLHSGLMSYTQDMATALSLSNTDGAKFGVFLNQVQSGPDVAMYDYHHKIKYSDINTVNPTIADISSLFPIRIENKIRMSSESSLLFLSDSIKADPELMDSASKKIFIKFLEEVITYKKNNTTLNFDWISESGYAQETPLYLKWLQTSDIDIGVLSVEFSRFGDTIDKIMCNQPKIKSRVVEAHDIFKDAYEYKKLYKSNQSLIKWCNMNNGK